MAFMSKDNEPVDVTQKVAEKMKTISDSLPDEIRSRTTVGALYDIASRNEDINNIERYSLVFVGVIVRGQGLELLLEALPEISRVIPRIKIRIIGSGPFLPEFKKMAEASVYREIFEFYGFIADQKKMSDIISSSAVGLSIWDRHACSLNFYYGDPGKTKLYTACGLPVIVSRDTVFSQIVSSHKAGVAIGYDQDELIGALKTILLDKNTYAVYKTNAVKVAQDYCDAEKIFSETLKCPT